MAHPSLETDPYPKEWDWDKVQGWFERRLEGRKLGEIQLLGARATLRSLPYLQGILDFPRKDRFTPAEVLFVSALRCYPISAVAAFVPTADIALLYSAAYAAGGYLVGDAAADAAYAAAAAVYAFRSADDAYADAAAYAAAAAVYAFRSAAAADAAARSAAAAAFEQDCRLLDAKGLRALMFAPLWPALEADVREGFFSHNLERPEDGIPPKTAAAWITFRKILAGLGDDFDIWIEWYQGILDGEKNGKSLFGLPTARVMGETSGPDGKRHRPLNLSIALIDQEFWKSPAKANGEIKRLVEEARGELVEPVAAPGTPEIQVEPPPPIPPQKPAALEPIWEDGRLILPGGAARHDTPDEQVLAALQAWKLDFEETLNDAALRNVSEGDIAFLRSWMNRIPQVIPTPLELHRIAPFEDMLTTYGKVVSEEWHQLIAARYLAQSLQFGRIVRQFASWRNFINAARSEPLSAEQRAVAGLMAQSAIAALTSEEALPIIDAVIPAALETLASPLTAPQEAGPPAAIQAGLDLLAQDVMESFNNVLKRIAESALVEWSAKTGEKAGKAFAESAQKRIVERAGQAGTKVVDGAISLFKKIAYSTGAYFGASHLYGWLVTKYPNAFGWLDGIIKVIL